MMAMVQNGYRALNKTSTTECDNMKMCMIMYFLIIATFVQVITVYKSKEQHGQQVKHFCLMVTAARHVTPNTYAQYSLVNATLCRLLVKHRLCYVSYILQHVSDIWGHHQVYMIP
jgi:hypothetical protein